GQSDTKSSNNRGEQRFAGGDLHRPLPRGGPCSPDIVRLRGVFLCALKPVPPPQFSPCTAELETDQPAIIRHICRPADLRTSPRAAVASRPLVCPRSCCTRRRRIAPHARSRYQ